MKFWICKRKMINFKPKFINYQYNLDSIEQNLEQKYLSLIKKITNSVN